MRLSVALSTGDRLSLNDIDMRVNRIECLT